jgi:hypothetical protein
MHLSTTHPSPGIRQQEDINPTSKVYKMGAKKKPREREEQPGPPEFDMLIMKRREKEKREKKTHFINPMSIPSIHPSQYPQTDFDRKDNHYPNSSHSFITPPLSRIPFHSSISQSII